METYLFKFSVCLGIFWLVYVLFLERQNRHHFKRFYLLGALTLALIIPKLTITEYVEPVVTTIETAPTFINIDPALIDTTIEEPSFFDLETTLWFIYGFGVLLFTLRFVVNLFKMQRRISKNETVKHRPFIYVLLQDNLIPHSFFRYIFFNKTRYESNHIPKEVVLHEETHAKQLHSIDIVLLELLQIIFWFHPLIYILKHHIKLNHEFLADQAVLQQGSDIKTYQTILLQFSSNTQNHQLASAINYSSIKKRFTVMKTQTSKTRIWLSTLLVLPIIAILFYNFTKKEYVEKKSIDTSEVFQLENQIQNDGASKKLMEEYRNFIIEYKDTNIIYSQKYERAIIIYDQLMSDKQRATVEKYPDNLLPKSNLSKVQPKKPTTAQFKSWKNENEYAIWLDGNHVSNFELNNYTIDDIVYFTGSKIHNNARSKKFPQPFQFSLYTKNGFKTHYQESAINSYNKISKTYSEAIGKYLKGPQTDNSELKILKAQIDKIYNSFTEEEIKKYNILMAPPVPAQYSNSKSEEEPIMVILINRNGELLAKNKSTSLEGIESKLKTLSKSFDDSNSVFVRYDKSNASEKTLKNVITLIRKYDFKVIQADAPLIAPPPPPAPPVPSTPHTPTKTQSNKVIQPVEILIKKDNSILLNEKIIKFNDLAQSATEINKHLTIEERRNYVTASIFTESNNNIDFVKKVQLELHKADIMSSSVRYLESIKKTGLKAKHVSPNAGLTVEQAKIEQEKRLEKYKDFTLPKDSPWAIETKVTSVKETKQKSGPIEINGTNYYYSQQNGVTTYYDTYGKEVKMDNLPPPPPPPAIKTGKISDSQFKSYNKWVKSLKDPNGNHLMVKKEHYEYFTGIYNLMTEEQQKKSEGLPPPPAPPVPSSKQKQTYKFKTESGEIIEVVEDPQPQKQESILPIVNGRVLKTGQLSMSLTEIKKIILTLPNSKVTAFKLKIPGIKTQQFKGNIANSDTIKNLNTLKTGDFIVLFDIKDDKDSEVSPVSIEVID
ncbi:M56 family metallopeptidase [Winogradskyella sp. F6397]|uniref:M56 family metallopeptidase n=1 Tax=Winogradskyella marina TaxID=2785530 RepID=A0ABS0EE83_9FLAO|nr:M56 family metallopeptidase [Winogradskyella marina]MBF8148763.1 M56 family metallopeptidase [Winogradskyella marina]